MKYRFIYSIIGMFILCSVSAFSVGPTFQLDIELRHVVDQCNSLDDCAGVPLKGEYDLVLNVIDDKGVSQLKDALSVTVNSGVLSFEFSFPSMDWVSYLANNQSPKFKIHLRKKGKDRFDSLTIPLTLVPYAITAEYSKRAKQFNNDALIRLDYDKKYISLFNQVLTQNVAVGMGESLHARAFLGDGRGLSNLTGLGLSDGHSLNSPDGTKKDVVFSDVDRHLGIHTMAPKAQLHIKGDAMFRSRSQSISEVSMIPSGSVLLWEPSKGSFISAHNKLPLLPHSVGEYVVGFGSDVQPMLDYSTILGGRENTIGDVEDLAAQDAASVIVGGEHNTIVDGFSVVLGGISHYLKGAYSVVIGGESHDVVGDYNVVVGGLNHRISLSKYSMVFGDSHQVDSDKSVLMGQSHIVGQHAGSSVLLGKDVVAQNSNTVMYSDGTPIVSKYPGQIVVYASKGVGVQRVPEYGSSVRFGLDVKDQIRSDLFIGDGRFIENVVSGQDYWTRYANGIYVDTGKLVVGDDVNILKENDALVLVDGAIMIGAVNSTLVEPGTLSYLGNNLHFFTQSDGWVTVNVRDTDTKLQLGSGIVRTDDNELYLKIGQNDVTKDHYLRVGLRSDNTIGWQGVKSDVWKNDGDDAIYVKEDGTDRAYLNLTDVSSDTLSFPLVVQSVTNNTNLGTQMHYPVVIGAHACTAFDPEHWSIYFKITCNNSALFYGRFTASNSIGFGFESDSNNVMSISTSSVVVGGGSASSFSFDIPPGNDISRMVFPNTYINYDATAQTDRVGLGIRNGHQYLYLDSDDLVLQSDAEIQMHIDNGQGTKLVSKMTDTGTFIIGEGASRSKLTIGTDTNGILGLNMDGATLGADSGAYIQSNNGPSLQLRTPTQLLMDMSDNKIAVGTSNQELVADQTLFYSNINPTVWLESQQVKSAKLMLEIKDYTADLSYKNAEFSMSFGATNQVLPRIVFSESPAVDSMVTVGSDFVVFNKSIGVENILFSDSSNDALSITGVSDLVFKSHIYPVQFLINQVSPMVVSQNGHIVMGGDSVHPDYRVFVPKDVIFNSSIGYDGLNNNEIKAFFVTSNAISVSNVDSLVIDTSLGLGLDHTTTDNLITLKGPNTFFRFTATNNTSLNVGPNHTLVLEGSAGVSVNLVDSDLDTKFDTVELSNPLLSNGGEIFGGLSINGTLNAIAIQADGSGLADESIPWKWILDNNGMHYSPQNGRVGIGVQAPSTTLEVSGIIKASNVDVGNDLNVTSLYLNSNDSWNASSASDPVTFKFNDNQFKLQQSPATPLLTMNGSHLSLFSVSLSSTFFLDNQSFSTDMLIYTSNLNKQAAIRLDYGSASASVGVNKSEAYVTSTAPIKFESSNTHGFELLNDMVRFPYNNTVQGIYVGASTRELNSDVLMVQNKLRVGADNASNATVYAKEGLAVGFSGSNKGVYIQDKVFVNTEQGTGMFNASTATMQSLDIVSTQTIGRVSGNVIEALEGDLKLISDQKVNVSNGLVMNVNGVRFGQGDPVPNVDLSVGSLQDTGHVLLDGNGESPNLELQSGNNISNIQLSNDSLQFNVQGSESTDGLHVNASGVGINKVAESTMALSVTPAIKANALYKNGQRIYPMPIGAIVIWTGSINDIPDDWRLCDGGFYTDKYGNNNNAPDLRDRFIKGVGKVASLNATDGKNIDVGFDGTGEHLHPEQDSGHRHATVDNSTSSYRHKHDLDLSNNVFFNNAQSLVSKGNSAYSETSVKNVPYIGSNAEGSSTAYSHRTFSTDDSVLLNDHTDNSEHPHTHTINPHGHESYLQETTWGGHHEPYTNDGSGEHQHPSGGAHDHIVSDNQPAYYTVAFIIKIK
jgi:hypothetical protein